MSQLHHTKSERKSRSEEKRSHAPERRVTPLPAGGEDAIPAAGAHAAAHLVNEDATPGAGVLPTHSRHGREVDGAAG